MTCGYCKRNIVNHCCLLSLWKFGIIGEAHVSEFDFTSLDIGRDRLVDFWDLFILFEEVEHHLDIDHVLPDEPPKCAKEAEWSIDLQIVAVEHNKPTDGQVTFAQEIVGQA